MAKIILTDYPKTKYIDANVRGLTTKKLLKLKDGMTHMMMCSLSEEAGGYNISYNFEDVEKELAWRKHGS